MNRRKHKLIYHFVLGMTLPTALLFSGLVFSDQQCKSADLVVTNSYGKTIRVTKINYRDKEDKKWRDNDITNTEITDGNNKTIDETLEYVGNEEIPKMQVEFQYKEDDGDWSDRVWSNVTTGLDGQPCVKDKNYALSVSSTTTKQN